MLVRVLIDLSPELILMAAACAVLLLGAWPVTARWTAPFAFAGVLAALLATLVLGESQEAAPLPGLWLNSLTFFARSIALGVGAIILLVNWNQSILPERGEYVSLILFSLLGILVTAAANDFVILFFALELVSVPTYVLIALSRVHPRAFEASVKYFFLGALAAALMAYGIALLYGAVGDTSLPALANLQLSSALPVIGLLLIFGGVCFKIAAVPFYLYAPDVYQGAASPISGMLGFVPKFAGFLVLIKVFSALHWTLPIEVQWTLWMVSALTMTAGNVLALWQKSVKRLLGYSSVAHTGYMLIPLLVAPGVSQGPFRDAATAILFYISVYGLMNLGAFAVLSALRTDGEEADSLDDIAGCARSHPLAALALSVCMVSLMGLPPTAGFIAKFYVFGAAFSVRSDQVMHGPLVTLAVIGIINTAISAVYYLRVVAAAYFSAEGKPLVRTGGRPVVVGMALCAIPMLAIFVSPQVLTQPSRQASRALQQATEPVVQLTHAMPSETKDVRTPPQ